MESANPELNKGPETKSLSEDRIQRFQNLKNLFSLTGEAKSSFFDIIHEKLNYKFPQQDSKYNDFILPPKAVPLTLVYDTSYLKAYENWLKNESAINTASINVFNIAKEYYFKWAISKDFPEKNKNKEHLKEICEKNIDDRLFFIFIFNSLIGISDSRIDTEIPNLLLKIQRITEPLKLSPEIKNKTNYLINILFGIYYLKTKDFSYSKVKFNESLEFSPSGITAKFYLAYLELKSDNHEEAFNYIKEIFYYDAERIVRSIGYNDIKQFLLYIKCAEFNIVLADNEFVPLIDLFEEFFREIEIKIKITALTLDGFLKKIKYLELEEFYDDNTKNYFTFLESILIQFIGKDNFFFKVSLQYFQEHLNKYVEQLISSVNKNYNKIVEKKLEVYDYEMAEDYEQIIRIQNAIEKEKASQEDAINYSIKSLENDISRTIAESKSKLETIDKDEKYNPRKVFSNAMLYNTIISFIVIIIGGFVNLTRTPDGKESTELVDVTKFAIQSGFRWGGAVFFFGCIVAGVMVLLKILTKNGIKTRLYGKIRSQSRYRIEESERIRTQKEKELESNIERSNVMIEKFKKHIEQLNEQKKQEEQVLRESADIRIEEYQTQLREILSA